MKHSKLEREGSSRSSSTVAGNVLGNVFDSKVNLSALFALLTCLIAYIILILFQKQHEVRVLIQRPTHRMPPSILPLVNIDRAGPMSKHDLKYFVENGYVVIPNLVDGNQLQDIENDINEGIGALAERLYAAGKIKSTYEHLGWTHRLISLTRDFPDTPVLFIKGGILLPSLQRLYQNSTILDAVTQLGVGPDIALHPAWNLRAKMQNHEETVVPWHQDNSYWEPRLWTEYVVTVWIALVDANVTNGCLQVIRGGHLSGKTATHTIGTTTRTWYTELDERLLSQELLNDEPVDKYTETLEVSAGSAIFFSGIMPHRSINSVSNSIRWSTDLRYHRYIAKNPGIRKLDWFYGIKDSIPVRGSLKASDEEWKKWSNIERTEVWV